MSKATPRSWKYKKHGGRYRIVDAAQELTLAYVPIEYMNGAEANAALIVQAVNAYDDMLAALRAVMAEHRYGYGLRCEEQVRAAIAKAEGASR